ncbi:MAG: hypothetical protein II427_05420, partial [Firmicutes bacterium]|nr:hypothetical protein [Bacillota bacterium]
MDLPILAPLPTAPTISTPSFLRSMSGKFRVKGETMDVFPAYADYAYRIVFWDDEIDSLEMFNPVTGRKMEDLSELTIFPANIFVTS